MNLSTRLNRVLLAIALTLMGLSARAEPSGCKMLQLTELPVTMINGEVTIEAEINGRPIRLIVDTGSDETLLFRRGATELGLALRHPTGVTFYGVGGSDVGLTARVKTFRVGALTATDEDLFVTSRSDMGPVQGLLGAKFLMQQDIEFDLPHGKIRFFRPKDCVGDQVVYWGQAYSVTALKPTTDESIQVTVVINGLPIRAMMDSGSTLSTLTPQAAARTGFTAGAAGVTSDGTSIGLGPRATPTSVAAFTTFAFGDEVIHNARLRVADLFAADKETTLGSNIPVSVVDAPQMLLGADFFKSHRVFIAREQHKVYVSYVGGPVFETRRKPPSPPAP